MVANVSHILKGSTPKSFVQPKIRLETLRKKYNVIKFRNTILYNSYYSSIFEQHHDIFMVGIFLLFYNFTKCVCMIKKVCLYHIQKDCIYEFHFFFNRCLIKLQIKLKFRFRLQISVSVQGQCLSGICLILDRKFVILKHVYSKIVSIEVNFKKKEEKFIKSDIIKLFVK